MAFSSGDDPNQLFPTRFPETRGRRQISIQALAPGSANTSGWGAGRNFKAVF
jgi:hypothetical protein